MTRKERVIKTLSFEESYAIDLGGMLSTGISCFAYPELVKALGLEPRLPKVHDVMQMLALPDVDVLDALNCDVASVFTDKWTNAFDDSDSWEKFDFNGRLPAVVQDAASFRIEHDYIKYSGRKDTNLVMPASSYVFDDLQGDESTDYMSMDPPMEDLNELRQQLEADLLTDEKINSIAEYCKRARNSTDRAILFNGVPMGLKFRKGMASWSMFCLLEPDYVKEIHELITEYSIKNYNRLIPEIAPYIDIFMANSDDQGTQNAPILPPDSFRELYVPYYKRMNDVIHSHAPGLKTFLHSCGAIYDIMDDVIDSGFDILNPVQWSAGGHSFKEWKDKSRNRIVLWGGGINTQSTLPLGTVQDVDNEVKEVCTYLNKDGGFVFCSIHNILAEISGEKTVQIYRTANNMLSAAV